MASFPSDIRDVKYFKNISKRFIKIGRIYNVRSRAFRDQFFLFERNRSFFEQKC